MRPRGTSAIIFIGTRQFGVSCSSKQKAAPYLLRKTVCRQTVGWRAEWFSGKNTTPLSQFLYRGQTKCIPKAIESK
jgi:hypothetical protein